MRTDMKRIILIAYDINPQYGSECEVANIWLKIISQHHMIDVFTKEDHRADIQNAVYVNTRFHYISLNRLLMAALNRLGLYNVLNAIFIREVKRMIKKEINLADMSVVHSLTPLGIHSWNDLYKLGVPVMAGPVIGAVRFPKGFSSILKFNYLRSFLRELYYYHLMHNIPGWKKYFQNAAHIIVGTEYVKQLLPKNRKGKISVIFDACVDTDKYFPSSDLKASGGVVKILFVGQLLAHKGILLLLEAAKGIAREYEGQFKITILGRGPLESIVKKEIIKNDLEDKVDLKTEYVNQNDLLKMYQNSDIFCLPAIKDAGGMVGLEAMACGLPVITSNCGGPGYVVTDECGIRINLTDHEGYVKDLKNALSYLIDNEHIRREMGAKARKRVEKLFSIESVKNKILGVYRNVLNENEI